MVSIPERLSISVSPDQQSLQDLARIRYKEDWQQFLHMPAALSIREQLLGIEGELDNLQKGSKEGDSLKGQLGQLRERRAHQQAEANSVRDHYNNARHDGKRGLYDVLAKTKVLKPLGEKLLYPLETTQNRYDETQSEIDQVERSLTAVENEFWAEKRSLEEKERAVGNAWQQAEEKWVLQDRERLFVYVSDNLGNDEGRKERLFQCFAQEGGIDLQRLKQDFEEFAHPEVIIDQGVVTESSGEEESLREEGNDELFDWREWAGWREEENGEAQEELPSKEKGTIYPLGVAPKVAGKRISVSILTEPEIENLLAKQAKKFSRGDIRMATDLGMMIAFIRKDPYGFGTKQLKVIRDTVGRSHFALRSLNPSRGVGLSLQHELSEHLRVVYWIYRQDDQPNSQPIIIFWGIFRHGEYERIFSFNL